MQDKSGNIWLTSNGDGLYHFDGKTFTNYTKADGLDNNIIYSVFEDQQGNLWVGTKTGLNLHKNDGSKKQKVFTPIPTKGSDGNIHSAVNLSNVFPMKQNGVWTMMQDKKGTIWMGTDDGVYCYDGKHIKPFLDNRNLINKDSLQLKGIFSILEDTKGNIWFTACASEGISRLSENTLSTIIPYQNIGRTDRIIEDQKGNFWFAAVFKGVCRYDGIKFAGNVFNDDLNKGPFNILEDKTGNLWFNTQAGLGFYDGVTFKVNTERDGLPTKYLTPLLQDKSGNIWFNGPNMSLYSFDGKTFVKYSE